jgi:hypothetical protein
VQLAGLVDELIIEDTDDSAADDAVDAVDPDDSEVTYMLSSYCQLYPRRSTN